MTTEELARVKRRNSRLLICAAVCLGMIFAWAFLAQPGLLGTAQASDPANPYEAEIARLQAEVNLLKRENERLRKELEEAKKDKSAAAPTDAQGPSAPQPAATPPPSPDKPPTAVRIPGLPETDSSWWRDPVALTKHVELRGAMSATNPQASVYMWLKRHNYFAEQSVQWKVLHNGAIYFDKDLASIEYYKCLGNAEKASKEAENLSKDKMQSGVKKDEADRVEARVVYYRGEAKGWKILMDAGGGNSIIGYAFGSPGRRLLIHLVLPGEKSTAAYVKELVVQGRIVTLGLGGGFEEKHPQAVLTSPLKKPPLRVVAY
jgi:hypothetical protein